MTDLLNEINTGHKLKKTFLFNFKTNIFSIIFVRR